MKSWGVVLLLMPMGCSTSSKFLENRAMEQATRHWSHDIAVEKGHDVEATHSIPLGNSRYEVQGIVDGEKRSGIYNAEFETFSDDPSQSLKAKKIKLAEMEEEIRYWKDRTQKLEEQNRELSFKLQMTEGKKKDSSETLKTDES